MARGRADVVMSDMAAASSGHKGTGPSAHRGAGRGGGAILPLTFWNPAAPSSPRSQCGGAENEIQAMLKRNFTKVANETPANGRISSGEIRGRAGFSGEGAALRMTPTRPRFPPKPRWHG